MNISYNTIHAMRGFAPGFNSELFIPYDHDGQDWSKNFYPLVGYVNAGISSTQKKFGPQSLICPLDQSGANYGNIPVNMGTDDFCVEAWVFPTATPLYGAVVAKYSTSSGWVLRLNSRRIAWYSYGPGLSISPGGGQPQAPLNQWSHIAITKRLNNVKTFMNGAISQSTTMSGVTPTADPVMIGIQNGWPTRGFIGYIDNVRVSVGHYRYSAPFTPPNRQY